VDVQIHSSRSPEWTSGKKRKESIHSEFYIIKIIKKSPSASGGVCTHTHTHTHIQDVFPSTPPINLCLCGLFLSRFHGNAVKATHTHTQYKYSTAHPHSSGHLLLLLMPKCDSHARGIDLKVFFKHYIYPIIVERSLHHTRVYFMCVLQAVIIVVCARGTKCFFLSLCIRVVRTPLRRRKSQRAKCCLLFNKIIHFFFTLVSLIA